LWYNIYRKWEKKNLSNPESSATPELCTARPYKLTPELTWKVGENLEGTPPGIKIRT
jgi:hypothetical protein